MKSIKKRWSLRGDFNSRLLSIAVELHLRGLPFVNEEEFFALKGGTAINFFFRDLPRLSIDIDLIYLPIKDRETALTDIEKALILISETVEKTIPGVRVFSKRDRKFNLVAGLLIRRGDAPIKVDPNPVLSESVFSTETRAPCQKAQDLFELSIEARTLSFEIFTEGRSVWLWTGSIQGIFSTSICCSRMKGFTERIRCDETLRKSSKPRPF